MELKVWIVNLSQYREDIGTYLLACFNLPVSYERLKDEIDLDESCEYKIDAVDHFPFEINEEMTIDEVNQLARIYIDYMGSPFIHDLKWLAHYYFNGSPNHVLRNVEHFVYWSLEELENLINEAKKHGTELVDIAKEYEKKKSSGVIIGGSGNYLFTEDHAFSWV